MITNLLFFVIVGLVLIFLFLISFLMLVIAISLKAIRASIEINEPNKN
jgi:TRAP-type mannitol/chloroaromatic compound transport system permease small subunit